MLRALGESMNFGMHNPSGVFHFHAKNVSYPYWRSAQIFRALGKIILLLRTTPHLAEEEIEMKVVDCKS